MIIIIAVVTIISDTTDLDEEVLLQCSQRGLGYAIVKVTTTTQQKNNNNNNNYNKYI